MYRGLRRMIADHTVRGAIHEYNTSLWVLLRCPAKIFSLPGVTKRRAAGYLILMVARTLNFNNTKYSRRFIAKALGISSRDINRIVKKFRRMLRERLNR